MACGMVAMLNAGVEVERYVAYEIDKYAIKTALHNFPMIEQRGDVFAADFTEFRGFDWVIGGSPCTFWSIAQKKNRETEASGMGWELFSQFVRAVREVLPRFFIYENNKSMSKAIRQCITETFGFEPHEINSALVSAQHRQRLYWVGKRNADGTYSRVEIEMPADRGILLKDILDGGQVDRDKVYCLKHQAGNARDYFKKHHTQIAFEPVGRELTDGEMQYMVRELRDGRNHFDFGYIHVSDKGKSQCLTANVSKGVPYNVLCEKVEFGGGTPLNVTNDGKSQTIKAQYAKTSAANVCGYTSTYGASGVAVPVYPVSSGKARTVTASYANKGVKHILDSANSDDEHKQHFDSVASPIRIGTLPNNAKNQDFDSQQYRVYSIDGKSVTLCGGGGGLGAKTGLYAMPTEGGTRMKIYEVQDGKITVGDKEYPIKLDDGFYIIRKLSVRECMRLQTVPEWYVFPVSDTQAYKMLGNGWTCDVITHLIKECLNENNCTI